ncbi:MAG: HAD family hydrolase [Acidimicrobiales bacterium]
MPDRSDVADPTLRDHEAATEAPAPTAAQLPDGQDHRLTDAYRRLADGAVSLLCLDVFDTLLWRRVPRPSDAFVLLARRLADKGYLSTWHTPVSFRRLRMAAELRAREDALRRHHGTEVSLREIWAFLAPSVLDGVDPEVAVDVEVNLEHEITIADLDVADLARSAWEQGVRVALVSNTYFSAQQLAVIIDRPELETLRLASIYASSDHGVHKANGLWPVVVGDAGVAPGRILHIGDDPQSDVAVPASLGVRTLHLPYLDAGLAGVMEREGSQVAADAALSEIFVDEHDGDSGLTGLRAKTVARAALSSRDDDLAVSWRYGAAVCGPVLAGFADWVHRRLEEQRVSTGWCLMREGELLAEMVNRVEMVRSSGITARPLWASRYLTARAALQRGDIHELRAALMVRRIRPTVGEFLTNLGLSLAEVPEARGVVSKRMEQQDFVEDLLGTLTGTDQLRSRIVAEAAAARQRLLRYLRSEVGEPDVLALVDLGWAATIQGHLASVLASAGWPTRTIGLYLATNRGTVNRALDGLHIEGFLTQNGEPGRALDQISRSPEVIEQLCLAPTGSILDFDAEGQPILDDTAVDPVQAVSKLTAQQGVRDFQTEWLRYERRASGWRRPTGSERPNLLEILRASIIKPTGEEARVFGGWTHEDNFGAGHRSRIVADDLGPLVPYLGPPDLAEMTIREAFWPAGLAAQYDPILAAAAAAVADGRVSGQIFEPTRRPRHLECYAQGPDAESGWHAGQRRPLRINRNGLSYARLSLPYPGIHCLRIDPCDQAAMFRLDWIELALSIEGRLDAVHLRYETEEDWAGLTYHRCRWLYDGVVVGFDDDPQVYFPLAGRAPGLITAVEVQVAMAVLPLPATDRHVDLDAADYRSTLVRAAAKVTAEAASGGWSAVARGALRSARRSATSRFG